LHATEFATGYLYTSTAPIDKNEINLPRRQSLSKSGWSWGCVSAVDSRGRTIFVADAHRGDGKRFVVRADEKLTAFVELEAATRESSLDQK